MLLAEVSARLTRLEPIAAWLESLPAGDAELTAPTGTFPFLLQAAAEQAPVVAVCPTGRAAEDMAAALADLGPRAAVFPSWETLPHERLSPTAETVGRRMAVISALGAGAMSFSLVSALLRRINLGRDPIDAD